MKNRRLIFLENIGWLMAGKIVNMILQFVVSLATARYLGPSNFGSINYVAVYISFFSSIASLGLTIIVTKEVSSNDSNSNEILWTSVFMRLITAILSTISVISIMYVTNKNDLSIVWIAVLESFSIIFSAIDTFDCYFHAKLLSKWSSIASLLGYIAMSIYRIYLLATGKSVTWFALATSVDTFFLSLFLLLFYVRLEGFHPCLNKKLGISLLKQSYHYIIAGLIMILYSQIDQVMLGNMLDTASVGYYSAALKISTIWSILPSTLIQSISPILYEDAKSSRNKFLHRLSQSYSIIFWLNVVYSVFVTIFARQLILLLYGKEYLAGVNALRIVVWYYGISTMSMLTQVYLANENKNKYMNVFCFAGLIVDVVLNGIWIPKYGINGAAFATLITQILIQILIPFIFNDTREITKCIIKGIFQVKYIPYFIKNRVFNNNELSGGENNDLSI